ncbi:hypothetical protein WAI453_006773 [Rhynchosporium graminicola]|uniref:Related to NUP42-nuclear pore protein n=1 Tax=Rhynchosporium graminicola TaxID=2792576 RepID=A0A1E1KUD2_9HELO|nr:related to NUP42-nuclear pore protein [Rhynchosporium commune]
MPPVVCRFWQQGTCRNGDRCKFLHSNDSNPNQQPVSNRNQYAPLNNNGYQSGSSRAVSPVRELPYSLDKKAILLDLTSEKPQWILSAYGPGRQAPAQLFGGPMREHSFEEMRLLHYIAVAAGNPQQAVQEAEKLWHVSEQQIQTAVSNIDGAVNYIINAEKEHPNRLDIVRAGHPASGSQPNPFNNQSSSFQQPSASAQNPFGGPSQPAPAAAAFGVPTAPAFGAPSALGGAFGQPSALGQKPNPFGGANAAFGAPTQLGAAGAFGQPSALGQKSNPFGASAASSQAPAAAPFSSFAGSANAFGQNSAFGAPSQPATSNSFGAPSNGFAAPSQTAQPNPFAQPFNANSNTNPFGGPSNTQLNPVGAPGFGEPSPARNPFGAPTQPSQVPKNAFGAPTAPQVNPFGGAPTTPAALNPFGQSSNPTQTANPFGPPAAVGDGNPFSKQPQSQVQLTQNGHGPNVQLNAKHPPLTSYSSKDNTGRLTMFKNKRVIYNKDNEPGFTNQDGIWERIWFPDGPPIFNKDTQVEESMYDEKVKNEYLFAKQTGSFEGGKMPLLPPKREWCHWDF